MQNSVVSYPRIGAKRELKFCVEKYFKGEIKQEELLNLAKNLRKTHWFSQKDAGIDFISSNDFSFYDNILDCANTFNVISKKYKKLNLDKLDEYFAQARGYQGNNGDEKALAMKKWFNTNYHYLVPECDNTNIFLNDIKIISEYKEAKELGIETKPVITGIFTFYKLINFKNENIRQEVKQKLKKSYIELLKNLNKIGVKLIQFDEPYLVNDLEKGDISLFKEFYEEILENKQYVKILLQTYFGDIRDIYVDLINLRFDAIGLDFIESKKNLELLKKYNIPDNITLFAGVINGKNIYKNNYEKTINLLKEIQKYAKNVVINTSCSLLHVPYTTQNETNLDKKYLEHFSFAIEKLQELKELKEIINSNNISTHDAFISNQNLFQKETNKTDQSVQNRIKNLKDSDFVRLPQFSKREILQKQLLNLPPLPTTTIGSFPQTPDIRSNRLAYKKGEISTQNYVTFHQLKIKECIKLQEEIGLDVLVHGESERNDMVEYFGQSLDGFLFTTNGWVQSYGTRCVKPPIIWGDISRSKPITVFWAKYAQSLSKKYVKGMLTGPVTILNWSFPREDISLKDSVIQIALAIRDEVLDLEKEGIKIIQIDEAALREKLPLRKSNWHSEYLDWAIPAFNLVHSGVEATTQIHTHMCYSEFGDIIKEIDSMDADVISFEAARSNLELLDTLKSVNFKTQVGPGIYDIHSPRVPSVEELKKVIIKILEKLPKEKIWINPDCGLKTRNYKEVIDSLKNLVSATKQIRG